MSDLSDSPAFPAQAPTAFVTGASRGIGRAIAVALAAAGYDVAISARTVREGEGRFEPASVHSTTTPAPAPGSLLSSAAAIEAHGQRALVVPMDLVDPASVGHAAQRVLDTWGPPDVLVNNAIYQGRGMVDRLLDTPIDVVETMMQANFVHQLLLVQRVLPPMIERGGGWLLNLTSGAGQFDAFAAASDGGWSLGYGASKRAWHAVAQLVHVEHAAAGIRAVNIDPGFVLTETVRFSDSGDPYRDRLVGAPPETIGAAVAWLVTDPDGTRFAGRTFDAQRLARERALVAAWPPDG